jgi:tetratricopeptide (TPR) repeat protein
VLELRAGRVEAAGGIVQALLRRREPVEDRTQANALNTLGIVQTELGQFDEARRTFRRLGLLDEKLLPPEHEQLQTLVNHAQVSWFMSDFAGVQRHAGEAIRRANAHGEGHLEAEAAALLGLCAFELGNEAVVNEMKERLDQIRFWMGRVQDRYLVLWFHALGSVASRKEAAEGLLDAAAQVSATDSLAAAKLSVVARSMNSRPSSLDSESVEHLRELRAGGVGWFIRRAARVATIA